MNPAASTPSTLPDAHDRSGARRLEVLAWLRDAAGPITVVDLASAVDLHVNTARFHLEALVRQGLAERVSEPRQTPGRPRILYSARRAGQGPRSYRLLAEMLTGLVSSLNPSDAALADAGAAWGRHLVDQVAPSRRLDEATSLKRLGALLTELGFEPTTVTGEGGAELRMHNCPFLEVAEAHTDVICRLHRSIMSGALDALRAPLTVTSLRPFVEPGVCVASMVTAPPPGAPSLGQ